MSLTEHLWWTAHPTPEDRLDRLTQRAGDGLVLRLGDVVRVAPVQHAYMQRDAGVGRQGFEHVPVDDGVVGHRTPGDGGVLQVIRLPGVHTVGPAGHVDCGVGQRLIHRDEGVPEPADALLIAEGLPERLTQRDRGVLNGVMRFDLDIALGAHGQVEAGMSAQRCQHVVVERDTGVDVHLPGAVEVELDDNVGFTGAAFNTRTTGRCTC